MNLKELVDAADNYHMVLSENCRLYNEVQDLKGRFLISLTYTSIVALDVFSICSLYICGRKH